ncbi:MAG TPA: hypothetical protein VMZ52_08190 [Bryobacteraceae bacterium]|nr:hypothetical protein [Bryobacteraceae bacterium]
MWKRAVLAALWFGARSLAGPIEFGQAEVAAALAARGLSSSQIHLITEVSTDDPECYRIEGSRVFGGDLRGILYGLLEAAEQIRSSGRLSPAEGCPATPIRGIRIFVNSDEVEKERTKDYWLAYIQMLARNRFNRLNLVFAHQTDYMAPPYPYWISLREFPGVRAHNLTPERQNHNLEMLRYISDTAAGHGIEFTLGIWEHNIQLSMKPSVDGLTRDNIGPYSYAALKTILAECPAIRSVQMRTNSESGIPNDQQVEFYRDFVFRAIKDAGRLVKLDLRGWAMNPGLMDAAKNAGVPLRMSSKYWAEDLGRPYQPAETWPGYSYLNLLQKPRAYEFYWELWGLGSHRLLLWGDPEYVKRAVPTFTMSETQGFEIDPPLAQKGFGNAPGAWGVFAPSQSDRIFWKYEFERYWLFYRLWGRLSYDPDAPEKIWMEELQRRFGSAAPDVLGGYRAASAILNEIVAAHLADPNMYIWPEINPGGLIEAYREVRPSDWRYISKISEAVHNRVQGIASAKQTPLATSAMLHGFAGEIEKSAAAVSKFIEAGNKEWKSTESDFQVLAALAQYHARKVMAADQLTYFYETAHDAGLYAARRELIGAERVWERLVKLTDGVYPDAMSFGPDDKGHWKDKLPYVRHDVTLLNERIAIYELLGVFDWGFDFGGALPPAKGASYRSDPYVMRNTGEPRFQPVDARTRYTPATGFGWVTEGPREDVSLALSPYHTVRSVAAGATQLPANTLFGDSIKGTGPQVFRVKAAPGTYEVTFLQPDRTLSARSVRTRRGLLDIAFPEGEWNISGLVVKKDKRAESYAPEHWPTPLPEPVFTHTAAEEIAAGQPLKLTLSITPSTFVTAVRLHYRPVNQLAAFKTLEALPGQPFEIPASDISAKWDLMYYFEILNTEKTGWFCPDPHVEMPYYVVTVK